MTPQEFDTKISLVKKALIANMISNDVEAAEAGIDLISEFIRAQFISAHAVDRVAQAIEIQTKMMAAVYNIQIPTVANDA